MAGGNTNPKHHSTDSRSSFSRSMGSMFWHASCNNLGPRATIRVQPIHSPHEIARVNKNENVSISPSFKWVSGAMAPHFKSSHNVPGQPTTIAGCIAYRVTRLAHVLQDGPEVFTSRISVWSTTSNPWRIPRKHGPDGRHGDFDGPPRENPPTTTTANGTLWKTRHVQASRTRPDYTRIREGRRCTQIAPTAVHWSPRGN